MRAARLDDARPTAVRRNRYAGIPSASYPNRVQALGSHSQTSSKSVGSSLNNWVA
jgi:hypothetical protein